MKSCSEYVSLGHPDKTADYIASRLLDEYIKHDKNVRFALEVQLKDHVCNLAGEITSVWKPDTEAITSIVKQAIREVGYTAEYASRWPDGATLNAEKVVVNNFIGQQSPDIAQGVDANGWGDQGVFMGMATPEAEYNFLPRDVYFSQEIGRRLYTMAKANEIPIGLDIKVLVAIGSDAVCEQVVVAAPMTENNITMGRMFIADIVHEVLSARGYSCKALIINGTGAYVYHSSVGDAGVVGRKLAVDFYGLNCPIGGGSPWGKDATKADVTLNIFARYLALDVVKSMHLKETVFVKIGCCIGRSELMITTETADKGRSAEEVDVSVPSKIIAEVGLDGEDLKDMFTYLCANGLFSYVDKIAGRPGLL